MSEEKRTVYEGIGFYAKSLSENLNANRGAWVFGVAFAEFVLLFVLWNTDWFHGALKLGGNYGTGSAITLLIAAPVAFIIWFIRDQNKQADIATANKDAETKRYDANLKDFHKIQEWASAVPKEGEESVQQVAAIHQLKPYLLGEMGKGFQRPAYEIYKALLDSWKPGETKDSKKVKPPQYIKAFSQPPRESKVSDEGGDKKEVKIPPHIKAIHQIIRENLEFFKERQWKVQREGEKQTNLLRELDLKHIDLSNIQSGVGADLSGLSLHHIKLQGANLREANLEGADLVQANLEGAALDEANLKGADLAAAVVNEAFLIQANLQGADLFGINLKGANLLKTNLQDVDLTTIIFDDKTIFEGAVFNASTKFLINFDPYAHGMIHVDDLKKEEPAEVPPVEDDTFSETRPFSGDIISAGDEKRSEEKRALEEDETIEFKKGDSKPDF